MAAIEIKEGLTGTFYFRAGSMVISVESIEPQQVITETEDMTIRVANRTTNRRKLLRVTVQSLQEAKETVGATTYAGFTILKSFLDGTVDWSAGTFHITDADGDSYTVRYIEPIPFEFYEVNQGVFAGEFVLRVEND